MAGRQMEKGTVENATQRTRVHSLVQIISIIATGCNKPVIVF